MSRLPLYPLRAVAMAGTGTRSRLFAQEAEEVEGEAREEDERLGAGHEDARDLLVRGGREAPEARCAHVEVVDRARQEGQHERHRAREEEGGEEEDGLLRGVQAMRRVLEDRPPEERAGQQIAQVLGEEERVMLERRVVHGW